MWFSQTTNTSKCKQSASRTEYGFNLKSFKFKRKAQVSNELLDHNPGINNPGQIFTKKDIKPKQIYHKVQLNQENSLRNQLLGKDNTKSAFQINCLNSSALRQTFFKKVIQMKLITWI